MINYIKLQIMSTIGLCLIASYAIIMIANGHNEPYTGTIYQNIILTIITLLSIVLIISVVKTPSRN